MRTSDPLLNISDRLGRVETKSIAKANLKTCPQEALQVRPARSCDTTETVKGAQVPCEELAIVTHEVQPLAVSLHACQVEDRAQIRSQNGRMQQPQACPFLPRQRNAGHNSATFVSRD